MKKMFTTIAAIAAMTMTMTAMTAHADINKLDINHDGLIDSVDASKVLAEYAAMSSGGKTTFENKTIKYIADYNNDGKVDAVDAAGIMKTYVLNSTENVQPITKISFSAYAINDGNMEVIATFSSYEEAFYSIEWHKEGMLMRKDARDFNYKIGMTQVTEATGSSLVTVKTNFVYSEE